VRKLLALLVVCGLFTLGLGCGGPTTGKKDTKTPAKGGAGASKPADGAMPATDKPEADKPAADKPAADKPAADKPAADKPEADKP
jgi:ribonuclease E